MSILSGEQLVHGHAKTNHELPPGGVKEFQPSHSWLEEKQIQSALDHRKQLLQEERVEKWTCLMVSEWVPDKHKARVKQKNKHWEVFGHHCDDADWLFPEEALFLMEMNCLECLFGEVPLSIQKGYTILSKPENGCSIIEYKVYAHLCRMGYRVVRHLPDLTVTAYEKRIRLDQHLDQKKAYGNNISESDMTGLDLPPMKIVELTEDTEVTIKSGIGQNEVLSDGLVVSEDKVGDDSSLVTTKRKLQTSSIEVIDIADSSESSSAESESEDSDIEIIDEATFSGKHKQTKNHNVCDIEDDSDIEVVEIPVVKRDIIVETLSSSSSEDSENEPDSDCSNKSYEGNWKRSRQKEKKKHFVRPATMENFRYLAVEEFCIEKSSNFKQSQRSGQVEENQNIKRPKILHVEKRRNEILDEIPTMAGQSNKIMTVNAPDLSLIPNGIVLKQKSYTFSTNSLRARVFKTGFRGRRNFSGPRFGSNFNVYNPWRGPYNNGIHFPNQFVGRPPLIPNPIFPNTFGNTDVQSMVNGVMQIASALLLNLPQNNEVARSLVSVSNQSRGLNYRQQGFTSTDMFNNDNRNFRRNDFNSVPQPNYNFDNSLVNESDRFHSESCNPQSQPLSFSNGNDQRSTLHNDFRSNNRNSPSSQHLSGNYIGAGYSFPPSCFRSGGKTSTHLNSSRNIQRRNTNLQPKREYQSISRKTPVDPAYVKPDVPICEEINFPAHNISDSNPTRNVPQTQIETIDISDGDIIKPHLRGISYMFERKRKRKLNQLITKNKNKKVIKKEPEFIFLDSPNSNNSIAGSSAGVKEENSISNVNIKDENELVRNRNIKDEVSPNEGILGVKEEQPLTNCVHIKCEDKSDKVKQENEQLLTAEVKVETKSFSEDPLLTLLTSQVKSELDQESETKPSLLSKITENIVTKIESVEDTGKTVESVSCISEIRDTSSSDTASAKVLASKSNDPTKHSRTIEDKTSECLNILECNSEYSVGTTNLRNMNLTKSNEEKANVQNETEVEIDVETCESTEISNLYVDNFCEKGSDKSDENVASWAEIKKHNIPIQSLDEHLNEKESDSEEEIVEIGPLIRLKHCKTIGTVLSALQIFSPFSPEVPQDIPKLKISFDMYMPSDFKKSQRGLPQYRIVVFEGLNEMPSPAQLYELQHRFEDGVPVLRAVVMPDSVVFYSCTNISLPVDITSYKK